MNSHPPYLQKYPKVNLQHYSLLRHMKKYLDKRTDVEEREKPILLRWYSDEVSEGWWRNDGYGCASKFSDAVNYYFRKGKDEFQAKQARQLKSRGKRRKQRKK